MPRVSERRGRARMRGFTLIELMYAAALFEIGTMGLVCFQIVAANAVTRANEVAMATNLASAAIEDGRASPGSALLGQPQPMVSYATRTGTPAAAADFFTITALATQPQGVIAYYDLAVNVTWKHFPTEGITHGIKMETYVSTE